MPAFANVTRYIEQRLIATDTTTLYRWFTRWMPTDGIDNIRAVLKAKNAGIVWQPAIQYAAVRADEPGSPAAIGNSQTGNGEYQTGDISVASNMAGNRLFRLGVAFASQPNQGVQQGDVCLQASWKCVGTDLGARRVTLATNDTGTKYEVLTPWMPATIMSKVKAAFTMTSITGTTQNLRYRLAYQTAGATVQQPNAWTDAELGWTTPVTTYSERHTGEITLTTTDMWFRLGVGYSLTTGSTETTAVLDAYLACR